MTTALAMDCLGWAGAIALLSAYALMSFEKIASQSSLYQGLNIIGSVLLVANTVYHQAYPSAVVNFIWIGIAATAMKRAQKAR
jgi:hypothetical protein